MKITNIPDEKRGLSQLIKIVQETNEPIVIGKAVTPIAILSAFNENPSPRKLGGNWKGEVKVMDDFDQADDEISDLFNNSVIFLIIA